MCFDGSSEDGGSENDGYISFADMFDGGGPGRSGARFSGAGVGALDQNKDNYISEAEYLSGEQHSISNKKRGISGPDDGPIGYAYDNRDNFISGISNSFGALPRGSIRQEAALGPEYGSPIETKNMARFLQGFAGDARDMAMAPVRAYRGEGALPDPVGTPEQQARSFDSIFNKGSSDFNNLPEAQRNAIIRGTRSLNPRAVSMPAPAPVAVPETFYYDDDPYSDQKTNANLKDKVVFKDGMYNFYENGQLIRQITEQEYNQMLMNPYRTA